jgi:phage replication-related protein YjqB (UPF0714/DUF867 family)
MARRRDDHYPSMTALLASENRGQDYKIRVQLRDDVAIIAPHGGRIEIGTSDIAQAIAAENHTFFSFEGTKTDPSNSRINFETLHVTSHNYDEPLCRGLLKHCDLVVAIHGRADRDGRGGNDPFVYLGGKDVQLRDAISQALSAACPQMDSEVLKKCAIALDPDYQGTRDGNICNGGRPRKTGASEGEGVQLEISKTARDILRTSSGDLAKFAMAIRTAIAQSLPPH